MSTKLPQFQGHVKFLVSLPRLGLGTSAFAGLRSVQLSYRDLAPLAEVESATSWVETTRSVQLSYRGTYGSGGGSRTHKIQVLSLARMPGSVTPLQYLAG